MMGKTAPLRTGSSYSEEPIQPGAIDMTISTIGLDLAKHNFHV
ncbi:IS110 family transposase, partial [Agrobacterium vitis]|nr:IS110 family transposase [Allorhizobium ampelinum]MCF1496400.1 IS110 family transposase [Allorhizobium ampelinum]